MVKVSSLSPQIPFIIYLEVKPILCRNVRGGALDNDRQDSVNNIQVAPTIVAAGIKVHLLNWSCQASLGTKPTIHFLVNDEPKEKRLNELLVQGRLFVKDAKDNNDNYDSSSLIKDNRQCLWLPQLDPTLPATWPCECLGVISFSTSTKDEHFQGTAVIPVQVTEDTLVRVLPLALGPLDYLMGEFSHPSKLLSSLTDHVLCNHNPETVQELTMRLGRLLAEPVMIGTGPDKEENGVWNSKAIKAVSSWSPPKSMDFNRDSALIVHSPDHGAGKTVLVQNVARQRLSCELVHTISIGPILAKYGIHADVALETLLHQAVLSAAFQAKSICVIFDHLTAMLPPHMSGTSGMGDAATPALGAIASYIRMLVHSLYQSKVFPFPVKNKMYNLHGQSGHWLSVKLCLVMIATCPDDGFQKKLSRVGNQGAVTTIFNFSVAARYRIPSLTAQTRLTAFRRALQAEGISPSPELEKRLPYLAAAAVWAKGIHFQQTARHMMRLQNEPQLFATETDFIAALQHVQKSSSASRGSRVEFLASEEDGQCDGTQGFASIGGNMDAKIALEEALALDGRKRALLARFGMSPPTGVLLYGPPGTGKTLMAKAIAQMLRSSFLLIGGAFVSINSTDVARAEVGTGEKILSSSFETARSNAPAVVFMDEFQALFTDRERGGTSRLTSTLLMLMDDCKSWADLDRRDPAFQQPTGPNRVIVLAATNTPWMIDKAFLRPGRFDRIVHVGLPDEEERTEILKLYISRMKTNFAVEEYHRICLRLATSTRGYSGADLAALCHSAAVQSLLEGDTSVTEAHLTKVLQDSRPSSSTEFVNRIKRWSPQ